MVVWWSFLSCEIENLSTLLYSSFQPFWLNFLKKIFFCSFWTIPTVLFASINRLYRFSALPLFILLKGNMETHLMEWRMSTLKAKIKWQENCAFSWRQKRKTKIKFERGNIFYVSIFPSKNIWNFFPLFSVFVELYERKIG